MPPFRPLLSPLYRGYVCSTCRANLRIPLSPPKLVRPISTKRLNTRQKNKPVPDKPPKQDLDHKIVIRHFEESSDGSIRPVDDENDIERALDTRIKSLEKELAQISTRIFEGPNNKLARMMLDYEKRRQADTDSEDLDPKDSAKSLLESALLQAEGHGDQTSSREISKLLYPTIPRDPFPNEGHVNISRLNEALRQAVALNRSSATTKQLWKWYSLNRKILSTNWQAIPADVWTVLWHEFSLESEDNPDRMAHIRRLGEDVESANILLGSSQILLYMEAIFLDQSHEAAISRWKSARPALTLTNSTAIQYWELGVKMLAIENQPDNAQRAADVLFNTLESKRDARVLIPLIRAWLLSTDSAALQKAWAVYVRLSYRLSSNMEMKDYDDVMRIFLDAEQADLALAVFRDMMLTGEPAAPMQNSVGTYRTILKDDISLNSFDFTPSETSWTTSRQFSILPRKYRNKFFYGSWIKKLIGDGDIRSAALVADLMYQHGFRPDARYLNGIIGAWFRSGTVPNRRKAEDLAWKMIATRMDFVKIRARQYNFDEYLRPQLSSNGKDDFIRPISSHATAIATPETFTILAWHYRQVQKAESVQTLLTAIRDAEIQPTTAFVNELLAFGATSYRKHWKWTTFQNFVEEQGVVPDCETFEWLWRIMKAHVDPVKNSTTTGFPSCRTLFAEMIKYTDVLKKDDFPRSLYDRIILCFGLADDQIGTAVALRALQRYFSMYPNDATTRSVLLQLAKAAARQVDGFLSRRLNLNRKSLERVRNLTAILQELKDQRVETLRGVGIEFDKLGEPALSEEMLKLLSQMLCVVAESRMKLEGAGGGDIRRIEDLEVLAAEQMGVPDCIPR